MIDQTLAAPVRAALPLLPGGGRRVVRILRNRIPRPSQRAGSRVERAHLAACRRRPGIVGDRPIP